MHILLYTLLLCIYKFKMETHNRKLLKIIYYVMLVTCCLAPSSNNYFALNDHYVLRCHIKFTGECTWHRHEWERNNQGGRSTLYLRKFSKQNSDKALDIWKLPIDFSPKTSFNTFFTNRIEGRIYCWRFSSIDFSLRIFEVAIPGGP